MLRILEQRLNEMANKDPSYKITPEDRKKMPSRGRSKRTLILESIKEKALLGLNESATNEEAEKAVFGFMAQQAFFPTEEGAAVANTCLSQLMKKGWPDVKAQDPCVEFDLDTSKSPVHQSRQIMDAVSKGEIPPSIGISLINAMASVLKIDEVSEIKERLEALEASSGE